MKVKFLGGIFAALWRYPAVQRALQRRVYGHLYNEAGDMYMGRWVVVKAGGLASAALSWATRGKYDHVRLHWIKRSDYDRELHNHPFNYLTFILDGWYREDRLDFRNRYYTTVYVAGDSATMSDSGYHRIVAVPAAGVFTLFCMGKDNGKWGFLVNGSHMPSKKFFEMRRLA